VILTLKAKTKKALTPQYTPKREQKNEKEEVAATFLGVY